MSVNDIEEVTGLSNVVLTTEGNRVVSITADEPVDAWVSPWVQKCLDSGKVLPLTITPNQLRKWARRKGIDLVAVIQSLPISEDAKEDALIDLEYATEIHYDNALVGVVVASMGVDKRTSFREALEL